MKKTALITGASNGIGLELAKIFARNDNHLVLVARNTAKLEELKTIIESEFSVNVLVLSKDLSNKNAAQEVYNEIKNKGLVIDYLINNAGFGGFGDFTETQWAKEEEMIALNITALTQFTKLFLKDMVNRKSGKIMNLASTAAFQPGPKMAVYFATKSYVLHFTEAIANEVQNKGVTLTALCPGPTQSGFQDTADMNDSKLIKGRKLPTSQEVAEYGYKAMMSSKTVAIHGWINAIMANSIRFTPRKLAVKIVSYIQDK